MRSSLARLAALPVVLALAACEQSAMPETPAVTPDAPAAPALAAVQCSASVQTLRVTCGGPSQADASRTIIGGQGTYLQLTSSNVAYNTTDSIFSFDVTVQNLLNEAIGTADGTVADPQGIQVFIHSGPNVTGGTGNIAVVNADGTGTFTNTNQPYFQYNEILAQNQVSAAKTWQLRIDPEVTSFNFTVYIETDVQYLLVINELLVNPGGVITDASGEWVEIYNAGTLKVDMQNLVVADSAASGRRPYHLISSSLVVQPGGYVTIGNTTNTTNNGGVTIDYAYGAAMAFANSLDAFKIARVYGTDTLTIDRTQYSSAAISAQNGISRELLNPSLDNSNMDGSNWGDALVTAVYGPGGRGTPKAQNSTFTP